MPCNETTDLPPNKIDQVGPLTPTPLKGTLKKRGKPRARQKNGSTVIQHPEKNKHPYRHTLPTNSLMVPPLFGHVNRGNTRGRPNGPPHAMRYPRTVQCNEGNVCMPNPGMLFNEAYMSQPCSNQLYNPRGILNRSNRPNRESATLSANQFPRRGVNISTKDRARVHGTHQTHASLRNGDTKYSENRDGNANENNKKYPKTQTNKKQNRKQVIQEVMKTGESKKKFNAHELLEQLKSVAENEDLLDAESIEKNFTNFQFDPEDSLCVMDIIDVLNKICSLKVSFKREILEGMCHEQFLKTLQTFMLQEIKRHTKTEEGKLKCGSFFKNFMQVSRIAINLTITADLEALKHALILTRSVLGRMSGRINVEQDHFNFNELYILVEEKMKEDERKKIVPEETDIETMNILPTVKDLFGKAPELNKNIVEGAYKSVEHYITVQFKLLHEDFVAPLREGIADYLSSLKNGFVNRKSGIAVYHHVKILHASTDSNRLGHVIQLDTKTKWDTVSSFFIFGSLLLFTVNDFKSFFLGTVIEVNDKNHTIMIKLDEMHNKVCEDIYAQEFVMAASKVFFEPYFHVLTALKKMKAEEFPMEKYIVQVNADPRPPVYINELGLTTYKVYEKNRVDILEASWPKFTTVQFNPSQHRAFQAALTNEFVAIQGPPGTGKTFLGHQIVSTLLDNVKTDTPILVVCYKNHALDQFIEGIMEKTKNIVRIGGRSKNENLGKFNLKNLRSRFGHTMYEATRTLAKEYFVKQYHVDGLKIHGIVQVKNVLPYIPCSKFKAAITSIDYESWLMEGAYISHESEVNEMKNEDFLSEYEQECDGIEKNERDYEDRQSYSSCDLDKREEARAENLSCNKRAQLEENRKRLEETYIDDYSEMYNDVHSEKDEDAENSSETIEGPISKLNSCNKLVPEFVVTIHDLKEECTEYEHKVKMLNSQKEAIDEYKHYKLIGYRDNIKYLKTRISFLKRMVPRNFKMSEKQLDNLYEIGEFSMWALTTRQRWALYHSWMVSFAKDIKKEMIQVENAIRFEEQRVDDARSESDLKILQRADVVGITTTGAAKHRPMLNKLGAKIVVVEEAAEVLESHIVTALSDKCQHVILIGDHKQLRPRPAVYQLCTKFNLDVSLFERMVKNGLNCYSLDVQHRMRPEFASLIVPAVYPRLINHPSVGRRPNIHGVHHNLYFINHHHLEKQLIGSVSRVNKHEAEFVVELACYLLKQGYKIDDISILATYAGQVREINKLKGVGLTDLRVSTVDDFQGEENKIIILSLVRSNEERRIGFLKTENRVCVALSRARDGFFIIGNMDMLSENSKIWPKIKERLLQHNALSDSLSLFCQNHPKTVTQARSAAMMKDIPEGGCQRMCETRLECGHTCLFHCHPRDQAHRERYMCSVSCEKKICLRDHPCPKICGENCSPCWKRVEHQLPCGHTQMDACSKDPKDIMCKTELPCEMPYCNHEGTRYCGERECEAWSRKTCQAPCGKALPCGHTCVKACHRDIEYDKKTRRYIPTVCTKDCEVQVEKTFECGHTLKVKCHKEQSMKCHKIVEKTLPCSHTSSVSCYMFDTFNDCQMLVEKILECGHSQQVECSLPVDNVDCTSLATRTLPCGHEIEAGCALSSDQLICQEPCKRLLPCGHQCTLLCSCLCTCTAVLEKDSECGHRVKYRCGREQSAVCKKPCGLQLPCGHQCEALCSQPCQPSQCMVLVEASVRPSCGHGPVMAPCYLNHTLSDPEDVTPALVQYCQAACDAQLECGHPCPGLCCDCRLQHAECSSPCSKTLPCSHPCPLLCKEVCQPCYHSCINRCEHGQCERVCGDPCPPCQEPCACQCIHKRCSRPCCTFCDRRPCNLPCPKLLPCGHPCAGFCGEVCPSLCYECDPQGVLALGGTERSRFVVLEDCGHTVEAYKVDLLFPNGISQMVKCPVPTCLQPIVMTRRYRNAVRGIFQNMMKNKREMEKTDCNNQRLTRNKSLTRSNQTKTSSAVTRNRYQQEHSNRNLSYQKDRPTVKVGLSIVENQNHSGNQMSESNNSKQRRPTNIEAKNRAGIRNQQEITVNNQQLIRKKLFPQQKIDDFKTTGVNSIRNKYPGAKYQASTTPIRPRRSLDYVMPKGATSMNVKHPQVKAQPLIRIPDRLRKLSDGSKTTGVSKSTEGNKSPLDDNKPKNNP